MLNFFFEGGGDWAKANDYISRITFLFQHLFQFHCLRKGVGMVRHFVWDVGSNFLRSPDIPTLYILQKH